MEPLYSTVSTWLVACRPELVNTHGITQSSHYCSFKLRPSITQQLERCPPWQKHFVHENRYHCGCLVVPDRKGEGILAEQIHHCHDVNEPVSGSGVWSGDVH